MMSVDASMNVFSKDKRTYTLKDLIYLMERLRDPKTGCPWDIKQDYLSITSSTIEEAYEVVDAIERQDFDHIKEELGDYLFQVIFYAQLAKEEKRFDFNEVIDTLTAKLIRRHPHVFPLGTLESQSDPASRDQHNGGDEAIKASWEAIKQQERKDKGRDGLLDDVPLGLPALMRATKLQKRAAKIGFDWNSSEAVLTKLEEDVTELKEAMALAAAERATPEGRDNEDAAPEGARQAKEMELADVMFTCVNLARHLNVDPEQLMRRANKKFEQRFRVVESKVRAAGHEQVDVERLERYWQEAKAAERASEKS